MEVIRSSSTRQMSSSSLNPNAPLFVPRAYQVVEDFSDEWWDLVHSSPWFRDYWLQECFQDPQTTFSSSRNHDDDDDPFLPDIDDVFDGYTDDDNDNNNNKQEEEAVVLVDDDDDDDDDDNEKENVKEEEEDYYMDLVSLGALKWRRSRGASETPKYLEKVPKFVNVKVNPRPIQQPR